MGQIEIKITEHDRDTPVENVLKEWAALADRQSNPQQVKGWESFEAFPHLAFYGLMLLGEDTQYTLESGPALPAVEFSYRFAYEHVKQVI